jgi:ATP-dependent HslUV protease ATP-binding subunit HslU
MEIAKSAEEINRTYENIGARRLYTIMEKILEDISFQAPEMPKGTECTITADKVKKCVAELLGAKGDLSRYLL